MRKGMTLPFLIQEFALCSEIMIIIAHNIDSDLLYDHHGTEPHYFNRHL